MIRKSQLHLNVKDIFISFKSVCVGVHQNKETILKRLHLTVVLHVEDLANAVMTPSSKEYLDMLISK